MPKVPFSPALQLALGAAANEAVHSKHEFILPEHLFSGITKLQDLAFSPHVLRQFGVPTELDGWIQGESKALEEVFGQYNLDSRQARHAMRELVGSGGHDHRDTQRMSRSSESRQIFSDAGDLAGEAGEQVVGVNYLLAALLRMDISKIMTCLEEQLVDVEELIDSLLAISIDPSDHATPKMFLDQIGKDLVAEAKAGTLHEVIGRYEEMRQILRVLSRKTKNNVVLVGEAGVGKTAIVEGLAFRIANQKIRKPFDEKRIIQVEVRDLIAGTSHRGDLEEKFKRLIEEAEEDKSAILFFDELHMLVGAGSSSGASMDAANLLKPALSRGKVQMIGATTEREYRRYILTDPALDRRFRVVRIAEPSLDNAYEILRGLRPGLERHYQNTILDEALTAAVSLSDRYMPSRRLPDKAIDVLEEACTIPGFDSISGSPYGELEEMTPGTERVTADHVRQAISDLTGIPVQRMREEEKDRILKMADYLNQQVIGQEHAVEAVSGSVIRRFSGLGNANRPIGVLMFVGQSGVGKTELAKATARFLFGTERSLIRLDMTEYSEPHSTARLIGSPPGYIGYYEGGQLTESLRKAPFSVVLLDEIEKAHPNVVQLFLQVFDDGRLTDGSGHEIDARNALFIMTSNIGYTKLASLVPPSEEPLSDQEMMKAIRGHFSPEFINRIDNIVNFNPLPSESMPAIVKVHLQPLRKQLAAMKIELEVTPDAVSWLAEKGFTKGQGARPLKRIISRKIEEPIAVGIMSERYRESHTVTINVEKGDLIIQHYNAAATEYREDEE
jgi:ATP-dependent Clp protease ATP-binding subunit ClpC